MEIVMTQTIQDSINGSRTQQQFLKGASYQVPDSVGQLWIGRGWATAATLGERGSAPAPPAMKGKG